MDPWHFLTTVAVVGLFLSLSRQFATRGDPGQLARIEHKVDMISKQLGVATELSVEVPARVRDLAQSGQKVQAIKELRQTNPWLSLKEAKEHVEGNR